MMTMVLPLDLVAVRFDGYAIEYIAAINGAPEEIRTPSLLIRSQMLYPVELRARTIEEAQPS